MPGKRNSGIIANIITIILAVTLCLTFTGCKGPAGPQGIQGEPGEPGSQVEGAKLIIGQLPDKTDYEQHEPFESGGLKVQISYGDYLSPLLSDGFSLSWNNQPLSNGNVSITGEPGMKTITVNHTGRTATFNILVTALESDPIPVKNTSEWETALSYIQSKGNNKKYIIDINGDVGIDGSTSNTFNFVSSLYITLQGNGRLFLTSQGSLLRIGGNQNLTIDSADLTLEGLTEGRNGATQDNNAAVIIIDNVAKLELQNGIICGNTGSAGVAIGGGGTFTMGGGIITGNKGGVTWGAGVNVGGTFNMSGGEIFGNTTSGNGGGVFVSYGDFNMSGGDIFGNSAGNVGGGVCIWVDGIFRITDGIIYGSDAEDIGNKADNAGAAFYQTYGSAQYGTYTEEVWSSNGDLITINNTIKVVNGELITPAP